MNFRYLWLEAKVVLRNSRFLVFTLILPAVLFVIYIGLWGGPAATYGDGTLVGPSLMVSMSGYGAMGAALSTGVGIAVERDHGWTRQLRLTPMSAWTYLLTKAALAMLVALPAILVVSGLGATIGGVHLSAAQWAGVTGGMWLADIPFAVIGVVMGQLSTADSSQAVSGGSMILLGLLGGMWIPSQIAPDWMQHIMQATPGYWLRQFGQSVFSQASHMGTGVAVLAGWTVLAAIIAARRYRAELVRA